MALTLLSTHLSSKAVNMEATLVKGLPNSIPDSSHIPTPLYMRPRIIVRDIRLVVSMYQVFCEMTLLSVFWSETTILSPACVFVPSNAQQIAGALKICVQTRTPFAVRGGGHTPIPGAANTNGGVLMGLDHMKQTTFGTYNGIPIASIGPGLRWQEVYAFTTAQGKLVLGGRYM